MSKAIEIAEAMVKRLNAQIALREVTAMVDRQKDMASELQKRVLQAGGIVVSVLYEGFSNPNGSATGNASVTRRYTVSVYAKPILLDAYSSPADTIVERVARALHNWDIAENSADAAEILVTDCDLTPDRTFLVYDLDVICLSRL